MGKAEKIIWNSTVELGKVALALHLPRRMFRIGQVRREGTYTRWVTERLERSGHALPGGVVVPGSIRWVFLDDDETPSGWISGTKADKVKVGEAVVLTVDGYDGYIGKWTPRDRRIPWYRH